MYKNLIDKVMEFEFDRYNDFDKTANTVKEMLANLKNKNFELCIKEIRNDGVTYVASPLYGTKSLTTILAMTKGKT